MGPSGISYFVYDKSCKQIKLLECDALALCLFKHEAKWNKLFFCLLQIPKNMQLMHGYISHMFDCWANQIVHFLLLKRHMMSVLMNKFVFRGLF